MTQVEAPTKAAPAKAPTPRRAVESGVPDNTQFLHPLMLKNYGKWKYHDRPRPGVLHHVAHSGDELWTVKAGTQRQMDVWTIRKLCDIIDKFGEKQVRFTIRSNVEIGVSKWEKVEPLIKALESAGFPVGGTGNSVSMIAHTQGWLHCDIPGTDASGAVKSLMDDLIVEFKREEMPNRVHLSTSCCEINCGGQADIAIIVQHTKPPKINHDLVANVCERPAVVARCPVAAIRPALVNGKPSLESRREEMHLLRRLLSTVPADADQRPGALQAGDLGRWQELQRPRQADLHEDGRLGTAEQSAALAGSQRGRHADPARLQGRCALVGTHGRLDRAHRLAALLREDRTDLHQAPDRRLARLASQPERVDPYPVLMPDCTRERT